MCTHTSQPTHRSTSISHQAWLPFTACCIVIIEMQSTGQTSRHDSQPVQLSALMIATSLGSFLRGPALAIFESPYRTACCSRKTETTPEHDFMRDFFHKLAFE